MNTLRNVGIDESLTTEQGLYISAQAFEAARRQFVGRKLFGSAIRKIDSGAQTYGYDVLTHGSAAAFDWTFPGKTNIDALNLARTSVAIPNLHKEFYINKLDLASSRMSGTPLNTTQAESAAYKVATLEDSLLINGYSADGTNYDINGLYKAAGNTYGGADWATTTNIPTSINSAIGKMIEDNITGPYNVCLATEQYGYALSLIANTGISYLQWIQQTIGGTVSWTPVLTAGTGMMTKADPSGFFEYVVAEDLTTETTIQGIDLGNGLFGRVYVRGLPVVYDANAVCTMTGLT